MDCRDNRVSFLSTGNQKIDHAYYQPDTRYTQCQVCLLRSRTAGDDAYDEDRQHQDYVTDEPKDRDERMLKEAKVCLTAKSYNRHTTDQGV